MSDDNQVFIVYKDQEEVFDIEDLDPDLLKQFFELDFTPLTLKHEKSKKNIVIKKKGKLIAGDYYRIVPCNIHRQVPQSAWEESSIKSRLQNAVVASKAAYLSGIQECLDFLNKNIQNHNLKNVFQSQDDKCSFIVAEDVDNNDVYVAFRGTQSVNDWKDNMKAFRVSCGIKGKFHAGFLSRANIFPLQKILNEKAYEKWNIFFCGHSMGGAVATIVTIFALLEEKKRKNFQDHQDQRSIKCFTFGAPMVGDGGLQKFCNEKDISKHLYHSVNFQDPVPRLLSYSMCLEAMATQLNIQVKTLVNTFATKEAVEYFSSNKNALIDMKTDFVNKLTKIAPIIEFVLETCCLFSQSTKVTLAVEVAKMAKDIIYSAQNQKSAKQEAKVPNSSSVYATIGNFLFLNEKKEKCVTVEYMSEREIEKNMDISDKLCFSDETPCVVEHSVNHYEVSLSSWGTPAGMFPSVIFTDHIVDGYVYQTSVLREVVEKKCYTPEIQDAELIKVFCEEKGERLQLRLTGPNLFHVVLDKCDFHFGFPFAKNPEKFHIKQMIMSEHIDSLILEEDFQMMPNMADSGIRMQLTTVFGKCEHYLMKDKLRNLVIPSLNQLSHHDSVSRVIKMAIQRGMGITQIMRQGHFCETQEQLIITKVKSLANFCLPDKEKAQLIKMFDDPKQNHFILSNEEEYKKVQALCDKVSLYLKSPVQLEVDPSIAKLIGIGISAIIGGVLMATIVGPGLVMLGTIEAVSLAATSTAGLVGFAGAGYVANSLLEEKLVDENYHEVLKFIVTELLKTWQSDEQQKESAKYQEITDCIMEGETYSLEKALLVLYDKSKKWENFKGTILSECKTSSRQSLVKRIDCIGAIHDIRNLLATQCYIGVVGIQDAGKTTLLNKIWGIKGECGLFTHTEVPITYQINEKVYVVDFPGSNSLDYHSKTFSICGAMNNLILVVIPFTGDINQIISKEISKVFKVMQGSDCTQVILCINKCGPFIDQIREELGRIRNEPEKKTDPQWIKDLKLGKSGMAECLAQKYSEKLNDHYEQSGNNTKIRKEDILFTDWLIEDVPGEVDSDYFRLSGIKEVKKRIGEYLLKYKIYAKQEQEELEKCLNSNLKK